MLDNKDPHQETGCREGQQQGQPIAHLQAQDHYSPTEKETAEGIYHLPYALAQVRLLILGDQAPPTGIGRGRCI
jgi:hypothetical protein